MTSDATDIESLIMEWHEPFSSKFDYLDEQIL